MKKKILIGNDMLHGGGVENVLQTMTYYFLEKGYDVTIIASPMPGQIFNDYFDQNVHFIQNRWRLKKYKGFSIARVINYIICKTHNVYRKLTLRVMKFDVAIALKEGITTKDLAHIRAKCKLAWFHCDHRDPNNNLILNKVFASGEKELKSMKCYNKVVCVSEATRASIIETIGDPGNLCVIYNPINWNRIRELSVASPLYIKDPSKKLLVAVGRLHKVKNYPLMLEVVKTAHKEVDFELWIVGSGNQKEYLEKYAIEEKLKFVKFLGMQYNPYPLIKQADLLINTSTSESYGISIQEAFILGVPVVAVKSPGIMECFNPEYGMTVNKSKDDIVNAILTLLKNDTLRLQYKENLEKKYSLRSLYEERMEAICSLFNNFE